MKKIVMMVGVIAAALGAWADTWTDPETGIEWTYKVSGGEASIIGSGEYIGHRAVPMSTTGAIAIRSTIVGYPVTSVGCYAFQGSSKLTSVTIPSSVVSIGDHAFGACDGLTNVTISSSVTNIGNYAFEYCSGLTEFVVDAKNRNYTSVNGLLLTKDGTTLIAGINGDVMIPNTVKSISDGAFCGCAGLTNVTIPSTVTNIGHEAFLHCRELSGVEIPSSVTSISESAFWGCRGLTKFVVDAENKKYTSVNGLLLTKDGTTLIVGVNSDVMIPSNVTSIGRYAFWGCGGLTSLTIPNNVTIFGRAAFCGCRGLSSVTIPNSVTIIDDDVFYGCSGLTSVTIPSSVTSIGDDAFMGCYNLTTVCVDKGDGDRVKKMICDSNHKGKSLDVSKLQFVEVGKEEMK